MYQTKKPDSQANYINQAMYSSSCPAISSRESAIEPYRSERQGPLFFPALESFIEQRFNDLPAAELKQQTESPEKNTKKRAREENSASENSGLKRRKIEKIKPMTPLQSQGIFSPKVPCSESSNPINLLSRPHSI